MFDKKKFKDLLLKSMGERTQEEFADLCGVNRTYISKYLNMRLDNPPSPNILKRIAQNSHSDVAYEQLMDAAGHINKNEFAYSYVDISKYLELMRKKHDLSQEELSRLTGLSIETISGIESGKLKEPSTDILKILASYFNIDYSELISLIGKFVHDYKGNQSYFVYGDEKIKIEFVKEDEENYNECCDELPEVAKEELKNFVDYLKVKYSKKDSGK